MWPGGGGQKARECRVGARRVGCVGWDGRDGRDGRDDWDGRGGWEGGRVEGGRVDGWVDGLMDEWREGGMGE
jgi:hypothetical protein